MRSGTCEPDRYGEALLAVIETARGRPSVQGSLVGVFEPGVNIQKRLEDIISYQPGKRTFGMLSYLSLIVFALLFLPMALPTVNAESNVLPTGSEAADATKVRAWPWSAKTLPAVGATDVDPNLREITVTFDRNMGKGMSWTGNEKTFMPPIPEGAKAEWRDVRTCVLPVKLTKGTFYRVGINATSFLNFKSAEGESAPCSVVYFTTAGATKAIQSRVRVPKPVKVIPENGDHAVDSTTKAIRVTFDLPMGGGMSWTGEGASFPPSSDGAKASWNSSAKTCTLPVVLQPGRDYRLGLNSYSHINFQSKWGVPIEPVVYTFSAAEAAK